MPGDLFLLDHHNLILAKIFLKATFAYFNRHTFLFKMPSNLRQVTCTYFNSKRIKTSIFNEVSFVQPKIKKSSCTVYVEHDVGASTSQEIAS